MKPASRKKSFRALIGAVGVAVVLLVGWRSYVTTQPAISPTSAWMMPLKSGWVLHTPGKSHSLQPVSDLKKNGDDSLRFELRKDEQWVDATLVSTYRSEVATRDHPAIRSVKWYAFNVYFPADFPIEDNRLVFAQWHPGWRFMQPGRIPVMAFRYVDGKFSVTMRHSQEKVIRDPDSVPSEELYKTRKFLRNEWNDFVVQAKWSCKDDGFINIWWNRKQIVKYKGPVGYDDPLGPQFIFGLYRDKTDKTYIVYFNQVKSGDRPEDVGFSPPENP